MTVKIPQDVEAEAAVLGSMLAKPSVIPDVILALDEGDFSRESHKAIYRALLKLNEDDGVDVVTVTAELETTGELEMVGGPVAVITLVESCPAAENATHYAGIVKDRAIRRRTQLFYSELETLVHTAPTAEDLLTDIERGVAELRSGAATHDEEPTDSQELAVRFFESLQEGEEQAVVELPWPSVNNAVGGIASGDLVVVAGYSGDGKTWMGLDIIRQACRSGKRCAFFSLEMSKEGIMARLYSMTGKVPFTAVRSKQIPDHMWPRVVEAQGIVSELKLEIFDMKNGIDKPEKIRAILQKERFDLIVVDHLHQFPKPARLEHERAHLEGIATKFQQMGRELDVSIILLSQLSRPMGSQSHPEPTSGMLRGSGMIEANADCVLALWRERDGTDMQLNSGVVKVFKARNGTQTRVPVFLNPNFMRFREAS